MSKVRSQEWHCFGRLSSYHWKEASKGRQLGHWRHGQEWNCETPDPSFLCLLLPSRDAPPSTPSTGLMDHELESLPPWLAFAFTLNYQLNE